MRNRQLCTVMDPGPRSPADLRGRGQLKGMGLAENSRRGVWSLNAEGRTYPVAELQEHQPPIRLRRAR